MSTYYFSLACLQEVQTVFFRVTQQVADAGREVAGS